MPFISNAWSYKDPQRGERNRVKQMKYNVNISIVANLTPQKKKNRINIPLLKIIKNLKAIAKQETNKQPRTIILEYVEETNRLQTEISQDHKMQPKGWRPNQSGR